MRDLSRRLRAVHVSGMIVGGWFYAFAYSGSTSNQAAQLFTKGAQFTDVGSFLVISDLRPRLLRHATQSPLHCRNFGTHSVLQLGSPDHVDTEAETVSTVMKSCRLSICSTYVHASRNPNDERARRNPWQSIIKAQVEAWFFCTTLNC